MQAWLGCLATGSQDAPSPRLCFPDGACRRSCWPRPEKLRRRAPPGTRGAARHGCPIEALAICSSASPRTSRRLPRGQCVSRHRCGFHGIERQRDFRFCPENERLSQTASQKEGRIGPALDSAPDRATLARIELRVSRRNFGHSADKQTGIPCLLRRNASGMFAPRSARATSFQPA